MKILPLIFLFASQALFCIAQVTFVVNSYPANTPADAQMYISGDFEGWTGGSKLYRLTYTDGQGYSITLEQRSGTINFKFTLGSWETVEKGANGQEIPNRQYTFGGNGDTVELSVLNWASVNNGPTSTAAWNVSVLDDDFIMPQLDSVTRRVWLYLPPDYHESDEHYPVLYMHDGQNVFDDSTSFAGEWQVDETLNELSASGELELIVVAIDNGLGERINEYSPWVNPQLGGGKGESYMDFIVETLKPFIDGNFRTMPEKASTGLMGSSMGGLISNYGALEHSSVFGKVGVFSPAFGYFDSCYQFAFEQANISDMRMYFLAGGLEGLGLGNVIVNCERMIDTMAAGGFTQANMHLEVDPEGLHNELFWRNEFPDAVKWLFKDASTAIHEIGGVTKELSVRLFPNPVSDTLYIEPGSPDMKFTFEIFSNAGPRLRSLQLQGPSKVDLAGLPAGIYPVTISSEDSRYSTTILVN